MALSAIAVIALFSLLLLIPTDSGVVILYNEEEAVCCAVAQKKTAKKAVSIAKHFIEHESKAHFVQCTREL
jgi:hypothetical protein